MSEESPLDLLAAMAGIEADYYDIWGTRHLLSDETKRTLLRAMGFAAETDELIAESLASLDIMPWRRALEPVQVFLATDRHPAVSIRLLAERLESAVVWRVTTEDGAEFSGSVAPRDLPVAETRQVDGRIVERRMMAIPGPLPLGYHRFAVSGGCLPDEPSDETVLIVAPEQAYVSEPLEQGPGSWGFAVQVYGLQGRGSWGMGDFRDLAGFAAETARWGAGVLGINPLHALFPGDPALASPYSPSSRRFLNVLYIDITAVPDYADCPDLVQRLGEAGVAANLAALHRAPQVDYIGVAALKFPALERLFESFRVKHLIPGGPRADAFRAFQRRGGAALERFATFEALDEYFRNGRHGYFPWSNWPAAYRDPDSLEVAAFARSRFDRVTYYQYLQWEADRQLGLAADACFRGGMSVGLYRDLAVGVDSNGAEVWADQKIFAQGISTGAPPDPFNLKGQSWGLPPYRPHALREAAYRPFIEALRANMRHAGALRIDHVMGFVRLFWVPQSADATAGGYVRYPLDDLVAIAALESHRARCMIVGEDLGTVSEGLRDRLAAARILSTRLLYFERDGGDFRPAHSYPKLAQVSIGTQDLPTFPGFWHDRDIALRAALHLLPSPESELELRQDRTEARAGLLAILRREGLFPNHEVPDAEIDVAALAAAAYQFLAASPARLVMLYLEDLLGVEEQINVPGTVDQYPNWRTKIPSDWQTLAANPRLRDLARILAETRPS